MSDQEAIPSARDERPDREHPFEALFRTMSAGFALCEACKDSPAAAPALRMLYANAAFERLVGDAYRAGEPPFGERWIEICLEVAHGGRPTMLQDRCPRTGRSFDVRVYSPGRGRVAALLLDVTERQRADMELERALCEADQREDELLGLVSHELRGPLNAIMGWAHVLREQADDPVLVRQAAETIDRNSRRQERLICDLLDVSRIVSGRLSLSRKVIALAEPIQSALDSLRAVAEAKQLRLESTIDPGATVYADAARVRQVAWNLIANAVKFSHPGGRIQVSLGRSGNQAELVVADDGVGLDTASLPRVFDRFWQADRLLQRQGLGVGLTIARHIVELHGGSVRAESEGLGRGARFVVTLPTPAEAPAPSSAAALGPERNAA